MAIEALRLGASSKAVALADVSTADLMSNLSDEQKADLKAKLGAADPEPEPDEDETGTDPPQERAPDSVAADPTHVQFGHGAAAERARMTAVASSEHFEGREKAALKMLGTSMSATEITGLLADMPKGSESSADMLAAIRTANPDLGNGGRDDGTVTTAAASDLMKGAHAKVKQGRGRGL